MNIVSRFKTWAIQVSPSLFYTETRTVSGSTLNIEKIRSDLEEFNSLLDQEYYLNGAGLKDRIESAKIYEKFAHLFNRDLLDEVKKQSSSADGEEERRLRYLRAFLFGNFMENHVKQLSDKATTMESEATVTIAGETHSFRQAAVLMVNEPNRKKRASIFTARNKVIENINPVLEERIRVLHKTAKELGYADYVKLYEDIKSVRLESLDQMLQSFLERTGTMYVTRLGEFTKTHAGVVLSEAEKHDISFVFRATEFDGFFKKEKTIDTLKQTLAGMGISLDGQKNIHLDIEERPKKTPRAFVSPIRVPDDVKLVVMPQGGHDDYASIFHEAGHAEHFGSTRADLPVEYRYLGDNSLTEGYAFLMEYLLTNPLWLTKYTNMKEPSAFLEFVYLYKLYFLRRYAAKLAYELLLHTKGLRDAPHEYKGTLESALVFKHPSSHYLMDIDDGFYCANYLRAWIFEAQVKRVLTQHFGNDWFQKKGAGIQLQKWWSLGQKFRVEEMLRDLGYKGLDLNPLMEEITSALR